MRIFVCSLVVVVFSALLYKYLLKVDLIEQSELNKCPYCYGTDLCELLLDHKINLVNDNVGEFISNYISVKNVFYAKLFEEKIVLKKLASAYELQELDEAICSNFTEPCDLSLIEDNGNFTDKILYSLTAETEDVVNFKVCSEAGASAFLHEVLLSTNNDDLKHIWTILQFNPEPLLLQLLDSKCPVPKYLGACGRLTAQSYSGDTLNSLRIINADWLDRAYLAYQLLIAAGTFTYSHDKFCFYLTDISPDNIAVDDNFNITFVDLGNVILKLKNEGDYFHRSENFDDDELLFAYAEDEICGSAVSDHNVYAVCKLLLSPDAPWPMMSGGLLHSPPEEMPTKLLFETIDLCVEPKGALTRFNIAEGILQMLEVLFKLNPRNKVT